MMYFNSYSRLRKWGPVISEAEIKQYSIAYSFAYGHPNTLHSISTNDNIVHLPTTQQPLYKGCPQLN